MPGLNAGLNIGLSGLTTTQAALDIIGNNIANVNTPGYSREAPSVVASAGQNFGNLTYGTGVDLTAIQGVRDTLLNQQIVQSTSLQSGAQAMYQGLQSVSSVFTDNGTSGLQTALSKFFTSIQQVAAQPEDTSLRTSMVGAAQSLVSNLQTDYQSLQNAQGAADQQVAALVPQVNTLTQQIAALNRKLGGESDPSQDNASIDQRQALANQLGQLVGVQTYTDGNSQLNITLGGGTALVIGGTASTLSTQGNPANNGFLDIYSTVGTSAPTNVTSSVTNGQLGAQLTLRDQNLATYASSLNEFAAGLATGMNNLQANGYAYNATTPVTTPTGLAFFTGMPATATVANNFAGTVMGLSVNQAIVSDPSLIAASGVAGQVGPPAVLNSGDNTNATAMAALATATGTVSSTQLVAGVPTVVTSGPFSTFLTNLFTQVGNDSQQWNATATNQENITTALQTQATSVSAVDLDTEATNLITYQRGYQAAASFVSTISTLMDNLINSLGK